MCADDRGRLIVVTAPSGAGKTTLVREMMRRRPQLAFSISYTTRPRRDSETDGEDYCFVAEAEFEAMRSRDAFLEFARVFDHWYGTSREHVERLRDEGATVLLEIDWQGAAQVRARAPEAISIFVLPPSREELERRLRGRGTDAEAAIVRRLRDALTDMAHWREFDYVLINDDIAAAADAFEAILKGRGAPHGTGSAPVRARAERIVSA